MVPGKTHLRQEGLQCKLSSLVLPCSVLQWTSWDILHLPHVMMAYRTSVQETTGFTPFSLMFGREARLPIDVFGSPPNHNSVQSTNEYSKQMRQRLEDSCNRVRIHMNLQQRRQKDVYDHKTHGNPFKVNDLVWLHSPVIPKGLSRKFITHGKVLLRS